EDPVSDRHPPEAFRRPSSYFQPGIGSSLRPLLRRMFPSLQHRANDPDRSQPESCIPCHFEPFPGRQMSPGQPATTDRPLATCASISGHTPAEGRVYRDEGHVVTSERRAAMRTFEIQGIEIDASFNRTFAYVAEARNLPEWTGAFKRVYDGRALMET